MNVSRAISITLIWLLLASAAANALFALAGAGVLHTFLAVAQPILAVWLYHQLHTYQFLQKREEGEHHDG